MNTHPIMLITYLILSTAASADPQATHSNSSLTLKTATLKACDEVFHRLEKQSEFADMPGRDRLVANWAECWKRSMNEKTKSSSSLQKSYLKAVHAICEKSCDPGGSGMKGTSLHFCNIAAYRYRTAQGIAINQAELTIPLSKTFGLKKGRKGNESRAQNFKAFIHETCELPQTT